MCVMPDIGHHSAYRRIQESLEDEAVVIEEDKLSRAERLHEPQVQRIRELEPHPSTTQSI